MYILICSDNSYYTGMTCNLEKRIAEHKRAKYKGYTSSRLPVELVYSQEYLSRYEAYIMERRIKGWCRKKKEALIKGDFESLKELAHNRQLLIDSKINNNI
ncbi:MAG: GIY-YIG nuclease family protein [Melioribacteraceae bacterium]|nr:GIY-YIG nuclease family protein [Melioribacteraceae bacterium]